MEIKNVMIWGKNCQLKIDYDCEEGEEIFPAQKDALKNFLDNISVVNNSLDEVKKYCLNRDGVDIPDKNVPDIFEYVTPASIFIKTIHGKVLRIGIMCEYKFDPECGIAVVFKDGKFLEVGSQNIIL